MTKRGRPLRKQAHLRLVAKPLHQPSQNFSIRLNTDERELLDAAAAKSGTSLASFIRVAALTAAVNCIEEMGDYAEQ